MELDATPSSATKMATRGRKERKGLPHVVGAMPRLLVGCAMVLLMAFVSHDIVVSKRRRTDDEKLVLRENVTPHLPAFFSQSIRQDSVHLRLHPCAVCQAAISFTSLSEKKAKPDT